MVYSDFQAEIFETVDDSVSSTIILVQCIENLSIPLDRARRVVLRTLIVDFEWHS